MSSSTLTLPQREQHRRPSTAAADATSPTAAPRSPWARTRRDLVIWLVLSDLFAVAAPFWLALLGAHSGCGPDQWQVATQEGEPEGSGDGEEVG